MRERSPEPVNGPSQWMEPPTFLTGEERDSRDKKQDQFQGPGAENQARSQKALAETQDPGHQPSRDSKTPAKVSVRNRIKEIDSKSSSPGKFPELKQTKLMEFLKKKSPKALKAREKIGECTETPNNTQGARKGPLLGDSNDPGPLKSTSKGPGPVPEERGGVWGGGGKKRVLKTLEKMPQTLKASPGVLGKREPRKRSQDTQIGKELKARKIEIEGRKTGSIKDWFQRIAEGSEIPAPGLKENENAKVTGKKHQD